MDNVTTIINFIVQNWDSILGTIGAVCLVASSITAMTNTPKDDETVSVWKKRIYKVIEILALVIGKAKQTGKTE